MNTTPSGRARSRFALPPSGSRILPRLVALLSLGLLTGTLQAESGSGGFHFDLLPVSLQSNPMLNMTVVTDFTAYGRTFPRPAPQRPVYFVAHNSGLQSKGELLAGEKSPTHEQMERVLNTTLAQQGFLFADNAAHQPEIALFYSWGSHNAPDREFALLFPEAARIQLLERSVLVGGQTFSRMLYRESTDGIFNVFTFAGREKTYEFLLDQASRDIQFVVVSAYAFKDLAKNERRLLWRTSMTVEGTGVSMSQTLAPLVITAGPYIGREVPATGLRRRVKIGTVELGPIKVIDDDVIASAGR